MIGILRKHHGMNIIGQGGKIILFTLPALVAGIWAHAALPGVAALPEWLAFSKPLGYALLVPGLVLWATAVVQLLSGFPQGKLVTSGAYGVVRNPIYSSVAVFILPAVSLITHTWVYAVAAVFLYTGVMLFIGIEEAMLRATFGKEYEAYLKRVDRMVPFKKPRI